MKKRWMLVLLSAGLFQAAMADVVVTAQGTIFDAQRTTDCPGTSPDCAGYVTDLGLGGTPLSVSFNIAFGATPGQTTFSTASYNGVDASTGRAYTYMTATQRYAQWVTQDAADSQTGLLPASPLNPLETDPGATLRVLNSAYRYRTVTVWVDTGEVFRSTQSWTLRSLETWLNADRSAGYERHLSINGFDNGFVGTLDGYDDLESTDYFVDLLGRSLACGGCVGITQQDSYAAVDETFNSVFVTGAGQLVSVSGGTASAATAAAEVPEPSSALLTLTALGALGGAVRRRRVGAQFTP